MESEKTQINEISSTSDKNDNKSEVGESHSKSRKTINWLKIYNLDPIQGPIISSTTTSSDTSN